MNTKRSFKIGGGQTRFGSGQRVLRKFYEVRSLPSYHGSRSSVEGKLASARILGNERGSVRNVRGQSISLRSSRKGASEFRCLARQGWSASWEALIIAGRVSFANDLGAGSIWCGPCGRNVRRGSTTTEPVSG